MTATIEVVCFELIMVLLIRRSVGVVLRITIAVACCLGIWYSWLFAQADYLFQKDTEESVRSAIRLVPDGWNYYFRLAQFDHGHASELLASALRLNRYNAQADIELGLRYEAKGDYDKAEKLLLVAYEVDHTYLPRWSLTNYYFRRGNMPAFWAWARSAAEMPADDIVPLFELCWSVWPDPEKISSAILNERPETIRQYLTFLLARDQLNAATNVASHLVRSGTPETDRALLFQTVNKLVAANDTIAANMLWHLLIGQHWAFADTTVPNNANFVQEPLPVSFDWSLLEYSGLHSWPGPSGLETEFSGNQPEDCTVAEQVVALTPGNYTMAYSYSTSNIPPATGIQWQIIDTKSNTVIADSPALSSTEVKHSALEFAVPPDASLIKLRLVYKRTLGTPRISGMLIVRSTQIQAHS